MDASGSGSDASDEQWDSPAEHGETSSSEECSSEEDEPCSDEEAEKVAPKDREAWVKFHGHLLAGLAHEPEVDMSTDERGNGDGEAGGGSTLLLLLATARNSRLCLQWNQ